MSNSRQRRSKKRKEQWKLEFKLELAMLLKGLADNIAEGGFSQAEFIEGVNELVNELEEANKDV